MLSIMTKEQLETILKQKEASLQVLIDNSDDVICSIDKNYCLLDFNNMFAKCIDEWQGNAPQKGDYIFDFISNVNKKHFFKKYNRALKGEQFEDTEMSYAKGCFKTSFSPIYDDKDVIGVALVSKDLTEKYNKDKQLEKQEQEFFNNQNKELAALNEEYLTTNEELKEANTMLEFQNKLKEKHSNILKQVANKVSIHKILKGICFYMEMQNSNIKVSILLVSEDKKTLQHGAAPSLPKAYNNEIDGIEIGDKVGSCGTAAYTKQEIVVEDIENNPLWTEFKTLALSYNLRACSSTPIISDKGELLGTFAIYYNYVCKPDINVQNNINYATALTKVAIEHNNYDKEQIIKNKNLNQYVKGMKALYQLVKNKRISLKQAYQKINILTSKALNVARVSIWHYEKEAIYCDDIYMQNSNRHDDGQELKLIDYPIYFKEIESNKYIAADDVFKATETQELAIYNDLSSVTSMLDFKITRGNDFYGVVCLEHTGAKRKWTKEEILFTNIVSDTISKLVENFELNKQNEKLKLTNQLLEESKHIANIGGFSYQQKTGLISPDKAIVNLLKFNKVGFPDTIKEFTKYIYLEDQSKFIKFINIELVNKQRFITFAIENGEEKEMVLRAFVNVSQKLKRLDKITIVIQDITDTNAIVRKLNLAQNLAHLGSWEWDGKKNKLQFSDEFYQILGVNKNTKLTRKIVRKFVHKEDLSLYDNNKQRQHGDVDPVHKEYRILVNGKVKYIKSNTITIKNKKGEVTKYFGTIQDISDRKNIENKLHKAYEQVYEANFNLEIEHLRSMDVLEQCVDAVITVDAKQTVMFCNKAAVNMFGYKRHELLNSHLSTILPNMAKKAHTGYVENNMLRGRKTDKIMAEDLQLERKDGSTFWGVVSVSKSKSEKGLEYTAFIKNVSSRVKGQQKIKEFNNELEHKIKERTADLESYSYSVSHDLRTPLRAIDGYSHLLSENLSDKLDDENKEYLSLISENAGYMSRLIDDLLQFSKVSETKIKKEKIDLHKIVKKVIKNHSSKLLNHKIEFIIHELPNIEGDETMITVMFNNLVSNAIKFSQNKKKSIIEIGHNMKDGEFVFYVKDNGVGFDMKYVDKLFKVFKRLHRHDDFEGTGIGLALVSRIVKKHGGKIWAEGKINKGAIFNFNLK